MPLHHHRQVLIDHGGRVAAAVLGGTLVAMVTGVGLARVLGLTAPLQEALGLKSATAPVAIALAAGVGADPPVVAGIVVASALLGTVVGPALLSRLGIRSPLARGLALGTISSGQGTAQALAEGELTRRSGLGGHGPGGPGGGLAGDPARRVAAALKGTRSGWGARQGARSEARSSR